MSFLNLPALALLLPLLGIPLLIHLFNKKFPRTFAFPSVTEIKNTMARRSKLFRLRHLILMAIRSLILLLLILAFLKPLLNKFGTPPNTTSGPRYVLIFVDHSLSMEHTSGLLSARKRAQTEARKIVGSLEADDFINVVRVGQQPFPCFFDFSRNFTEAMRFVDTLPPGYQQAHFNKANAFAANAFTKAQGRFEVYFLSDFQRSNWGNVSFESLPEKARLFFVNTGSKQRENHGILSATIDESVILAGQSLNVNLTLGNFTSTTLSAPIEILVNDQSVSLVDTETMPWSVSNVTLPIKAPGPGLHRIEFRLPNDDLNVDNAYYLVTSVLDKEEVVLVSDNATEDQDSTRFLRTAMNPFEELAGSLLPRVFSSGELTQTAISTTSKIVLTGIESPSPDQWKILTDFVKSGGGLIYFLDGPNDASNLGSLSKAIDPEPQPLRLLGKRTPDEIGASSLKLAKGNFKSPFLRLFRGTQRQNLALLDFYEVYQAIAHEDAEVLLSFADGTPALVSTSYGRGTILFANFSVAESTSNLARQPLFPAWTQEMVKHIGSEDFGNDVLHSGDEIQVEVWQRELKEGEMRAPDGTPVALKKEPRDQRMLIAFTANAPGIYALPNHDNPRYAFAVNHSVGESDLRMVDTEMLPQRANEESTDSAYYIDDLANYEEIQKGRPIFHYFVLAAIILIFGELILFQTFKTLAAK